MIVSWVNNQTQIHPVEHMAAVWPLWNRLLNPPESMWWRLEWAFHWVQKCRAVWCCLLWKTHMCPWEYSLGVHQHLTMLSGNWGRGGELKGYHYSAQFFIVCVWGGVGGLRACVSEWKRKAFSFLISHSHHQHRIQGFISDHISQTSSL